MKINLKFSKAIVLIAMLGVGCKKESTILTSERKEVKRIETSGVSPVNNFLAENFDLGPDWKARWVENNFLFLNIKKKGIRDRGAGYFYGCPSIHLHIADGRMQEALRLMKLHIKSDNNPFVTIENFPRNPNYIYLTLDRNHGPTVSKAVTDIVSLLKKDGLVVDYGYTTAYELSESIFYMNGSTRFSKRDQLLGELLKKAFASLSTP